LSVSGIGQRVHSRQIGEAQRKCQNDSGTPGLEEAMRTLEEATTFHGRGGFVDVWVTRAMIQQRLGNGDAARRELARYENWLKAQKFENWQEATRWQLFHEEARALILSMPRAVD
jgi:hypothetical protein